MGKNIINNLIDMQLNWVQITTVKPKSEDAYAIFQGYSRFSIIYALFQGFQGPISKFQAIQGFQGFFKVVATLMYPWRGSSSSPGLEHEDTKQT